MSWNSGLFPINFVFLGKPKTKKKKKKERRLLTLKIKNPVVKENYYFKY